MRQHEITIRKVCNHHFRFPFRASLLQSIGIQPQTFLGETKQATTNSPTHPKLWSAPSQHISSTFPMRHHSTTWRHAFLLFFLHGHSMSRHLTRIFNSHKESWVEAIRHIEMIVPIQPPIFIDLHESISSQGFGRHCQCSLLCPECLFEDGFPVTWGMLKSQCRRKNQELDGFQGFYSEMLQVTLNHTTLWMCLMDTYFLFKSALQNLSKKKGVETQNNQFQARIAPNKAVGMHEDTAWHVTMVSPVTLKMTSFSMVFTLRPLSSNSFPSIPSTVSSPRAVFFSPKKGDVWKGIKSGHLSDWKKIWILDPRFLLQICTWNLCNFRELCVTKSTPGARKFLPGGEKL